MEEVENTVVADPIEGTGEIGNQNPAPSAPVVKSPQELAAEAKTAEEARLHAQVPFDPKLHGVGVHPAMGPQSVTELYKLFLALEARVGALESKAGGTGIPAVSVGK
jgi:hypothetical protein